MNQTTLKIRKPKLKNSTVESMHLEEVQKLSTILHYPYTQSDMMGLTWVFFEDDW
jgi:hypothetical protein